MAAAGAELPAVIPVTNRQRAVAVLVRDVRAVVAGVFDAEHAGEPDVGVVLVDDAAMRDLNRRHLQHDWATDVIAFDYGDDPAPDGLRGEIFASGETAAREARARGRQAGPELLLYVAHGTLHLLGWEDDTPQRRRRMNARAAAILSRLGLDR